MLAPLQQPHHKGRGFEACFDQTPHDRTSSDNKPEASEALHNITATYILSFDQLEALAQIQCIQTSLKHPNVDQIHTQRMLHHASSSLKL